ncbi:tetratricopeptide repeat protein [Pseudotabrizicola sp. L79]|uniref:tetratricopeptide repeat protein n=1 Tax=Pseudotabrizicola sp. L79 TaxID=3118402 RepID=UPI002F93C2C9
MKRSLFSALATMVCLAQPVASAGQPDLARSAQTAFTAGQVEMARMLALAALNSDPKDPTALAVLAAVGLATKEPEAARIVAAQSFRAAPDREGKFTAARLAARAAVETEQTGVAKYWLRRAVQVAPNDTARAATIRDFTALRAHSRLRFDVDLSIRPSDNVNQGARDQLLVIDGNPTWFYFDGSSMALSGIETAASLGLRYRLAGTAAAPTEVGLRLYHRAVSLSNEAKTQAPTASGADFSNSALDATVFHTQILSDTQSLRGGLTLGRSWLADKPYADRARMEGALSTRHDLQTRSRVGFAIERQWLTSGKPPATAFSLEAGVQRALDWGDSVAIKLEAAETVSNDANQEHRRVGASLRYMLGKPVAGAVLSGGLGVAARDYPVFFNGIFNDTGREDVTLSGSVDMALPKLGAFGFEPVVSIEASRTRSNVSRYDGQSLGIGLQIQSSF